MSKHRKRYSQEYKHEAVKLASRPEMTIARAATELGINPQMLGRWCREAREHGRDAFPGAGKARDEEIYRLKRELKQVRKERDFLREAAAFFAKQSK